jgi:hypothetical protein
MHAGLGKKAVAGLGLLSVVSITGKSSETLERKGLDLGQTGHRNGHPIVRWNGWDWLPFDWAVQNITIDHDKDETQTASPSKETAEVIRRWFER